MPSAARGISTLPRRAYLWLTTSPRDKLNRRDYIDPRAAARAQRDRVQRVNDIFHSAGRQGQILTIEGITLQFKGNAWAFLCVPAVLGMALILFVANYDFAERQAAKEERGRFLEGRAAAAAQYTSDAKAKLVATVEELPNTLRDLAVTDEERQLADQLDANLNSVVETISREPWRAPAARLHDQS